MTNQDQSEQTVAEGANSAADVADTPTPNRRGGRPFARLGQLLTEVDTAQLVVALLIGLALVVFARGLMLGVTGEDRYRLPDEIESISPVPDAVQAPPSGAIEVDLASGYTGVLTIDGHELQTVDISQIEKEPGSQLSLPAVTIYEPGNATLRFLPSDDSPIPPFEPGTHSVILRYWPAVAGPQRSATYAWSFNVG